MGWASAGALSAKAWPAWQSDVSPTSSACPEDLPPTPFPSSSLTPHFIPYPATTTLPGQLLALISTSAPAPQLQHTPTAFPSFTQRLASPSPRQQSQLLSLPPQLALSASALPSSSSPSPCPTALAIRDGLAECSIPSSSAITATVSTLSPFASPHLAGPLPPPPACVPRALPPAASPPPPPAPIPTPPQQASLPATTLFPPQMHTSTGVAPDTLGMKATARMQPDKHGESLPPSATPGLTPAGTATQPDREARGISSVSSELAASAAPPMFLFRQAEVRCTLRDKHSQLSTPASTHCVLGAPQISLLSSCAALSTFLHFRARSSPCCPNRLHFHRLPPALAALNGLPSPPVCRSHSLFSSPLPPPSGQKGSCALPNTHSWPAAWYHNLRGGVSGWEQQFEHPLPPHAWFLLTSYTFCLSPTSLVLALIRLFPVLPLTPSHKPSSLLPACRAIVMVSVMRLPILHNSGAASLQHRLMRAHFLSMRYAALGSSFAGRSIRPPGKPALLARASHRLVTHRYQHAMARLKPSTSRPR